MPSLDVRSLYTSLSASVRAETGSTPALVNPMLAVSPVPSACAPGSMTPGMTLDRHLAAHAADSAAAQTTHVAPPVKVSSRSVHGSTTTVIIVIFISRLPERHKLTEPATNKTSK